MVVRVLPPTIKYAATVRRSSHALDIRRQREHSNYNNSTDSRHNTDFMLTSLTLRQKSNMSGCPGAAILLLAVAHFSTSADAFISLQQSSLTARQVVVHESLREKAAQRQRERQEAKEVQDAANAQARLNAEYAAYRRTKAFSGESIEAFADRRASVRRAAQRNGFIAFVIVVLLNLRLALSPPELKAVANDPNGLCVAPRGDRLRPGRERLNSYGGPCMEIVDFARALLIPF